LEWVTETYTPAIISEPDVRTGSLEATCMVLLPLLMVNGESGYETVQVLPAEPAELYIAAVNVPEAKGRMIVPFLGRFPEETILTDSATIRVT
jgi:hypothetical protein